MTWRRHFPAIWWGDSPRLSALHLLVISQDLGLVSPNLMGNCQFPVRREFVMADTARSRGLRVESGVYGLRRAI